MSNSKTRGAGTGAKAPTKVAASAVTKSAAVAETASDTAVHATGKITAGQALENTRALLAAKRDRARLAPNYPVGAPVHPGAQGPHGVASAQPEHAPTERRIEALHGHAYATEHGDESKRSQS